MRTAKPQVNQDSNEVEVNVLRRITWPSGRVFQTGPGLQAMRVKLLDHVWRLDTEKSLAEDRSLANPKRPEPFSGESRPMSAREFEAIGRKESIGSQRVHWQSSCNCVYKEDCRGYREALVRWTCLHTCMYVCIFTSMCASVTRTYTNIHTCIRIQTNEQTNK